MPATIHHTPDSDPPPPSPCFRWPPEWAVIDAVVAARLGPPPYA